MKKFNFFTRLFTVSTLLIFSLALVSCASTRADGGISDQVKADFSEAELSNGIPVVFKRNKSGQIFALRMIIEGGVALYPQEKSGIENVALSMIFHGSEKYPYEDIQKLEYEKSFSMSASAGKDYSVAGFTCIYRDFDSVFDLFADSFKNPLMKEDDFDRIMAGEKESVARTMADPSGLLGYLLNQTAYKGHPYSTSTGATVDSVDKITLEEVKRHAENLKNAARIKFVIVGELSSAEQKKILSKLESQFGSLEKSEYTKPEIAQINVEGETVYGSSEQAGNTGYAIAYFKGPDRYDDDYVAYALAGMYIDDLLFAKVREENGACYSIGTGVLGGRDMLGALSVYKATKANDLQKIINEAVDSFPPVDEIRRTLDQHKNKYITSLFSSSQNTAGVASNVCTSLEYSGIPEKYLYRSAEVTAVTAEQVYSAWQKYFARSSEKAGGEPNKWRWVSVSGPKAKYNFD